MSQTRQPQNTGLPFLDGGGEMGQLIRSVDWSSTPIGNPESWPVSLKLNTGMMLSAPFPMLICWGEGYTQLYNDAFRPILGQSKHPRAMGISASETYAEIWDTIGPMFAGVMAGQAVGFPNFMVPLDRNGYLEDCYFDFSYNPIRDEQGHIGGILVICVETTEKVLALEKLEQANREIEQAQKEAVSQRDKLTDFFMQAPAGVCVLGGPDLVFELVNPAYQQLLPGRKLLNRPIFEALPELIDQPLHDILLNVYNTGESYNVNELLIPIAEYEGGPTRNRYFTFNYLPRMNAEDKVDGILVFVFEVTDMIMAQHDQHAMNEELAASNEESVAINEELRVTNEELIEFQHRLENLAIERQTAIDRLKANEQNIRNMVKQAPMGMCIIEGDPLYVVEINDSFLELIGKTREELKLRPYWEVVAEAAPYYKPITDTVMATGITYHADEHEIMLIRQGREEIVHVDFVYEPMKNIDGSTYAIMIVAIDVTDKVMARKNVERAEESLRMAIDAAGLGAYYINVIDRIFYPSPRLKEFFGFAPDEEVPYEAAINQIHPDYRQAAADLVEAAITKGVRFDMEYPIVAHNDGKIRWVRGIGTVQQDDHGVNRYFTGVLHEITEQKQDEIRKNDFIGMVSHELKTPLTSLTAIVQLLNKKLKDSDDTFIAGAMDKANIQVKKMSNMINGFLNISRLESGKIYLNMQDFNLDELVAEMIDEIKLTVTSHHFTFIPCKAIPVHADRDKIGSVISNLLSNAVKYSPKGKEITVSCELVGNKALVSVKDEGMGIKQKDIDNLFDRYYRVESKHTQHISGFGIGLYLSAEIVKRHDGEIGVESESGVGSTFHFSLPAG